MAKVTLILITTMIIISCGKKDDITPPTEESLNKPAKIDKERVYKF